jgi:hypothetical protein
MRFITCLLMVFASSIFALSLEGGAGICLPSGSFGIRNQESLSYMGCISQEVDYLLDLESKVNYASGKSYADDFKYTITNISIGIVGHNFFGSRNPYVGFSMGYYRYKDIWALPGLYERFSGNIMMALRSKLGGSNSPVDLDLRFDWHLFPKVPIKYLIYYYPSEQILPHKIEYRRIYDSSLSYLCITFGLCFKLF